MSQDQKEEDKSLHAALNRLQGNEAFEILLSHLESVYLMDASVSSNGEFAMRKEGAREVVVTLLNLVEEQKQNG